MKYYITLSGTKAYFNFMGMGSQQAQTHHATSNVVAESAEGFLTLRVPKVYSTDKHQFEVHRILKRETAFDVVTEVVNCFPTNAKSLGDIEETSWVERTNNPYRFTPRHRFPVKIS